jgi:hypothetical protein
LAFELWKETQGGLKSHFSRKTMDDPARRSNNSQFLIPTTCALIAAPQGCPAAEGTDMPLAYDYLF